MTTECWGCRCVKENGPLSKVYGPPSCIDCAARGIATVYGGGPKEDMDAVMRKTWTDTKEFTEGRLKVWLWIRAIEEAKAKQ